MDIGSSTVANGVLGLVIGVITTLVVDMAFLVQVKFVHLIFGPNRKRFRKIMMTSYSGFQLSST